MGGGDRVRREIIKLSVTLILNSVRERLTDSLRREETEGGSDELDVGAHSVTQW